MNKHKNKNSPAKALSDKTLENADGGTYLKTVKMIKMFTAPQ